MLDTNYLGNEVWGWVPTNDPVFFITPWYEGSSSTGYGLGTGWPAPFFQESLMLTNLWVNEPGLFTFLASGQPTWNSRHIIYRFKLGIHIFISELSSKRSQHHDSVTLHCYRDSLHANQLNINNFLNMYNIKVINIKIYLLVSISSKICKFLFKVYIYWHLSSVVFIVLGC